MLEKNYVAHVRQDKSGKWLTHKLCEHLDKTSREAGKFAKAFDNADWAEAAGLWHDLGKFLPSWQKYIRRETGYDVNMRIEGDNSRPNHSSVGAVLALQKFKFSSVGRILAYIIAGHHAGLPDWLPDEAGGDLVNRIYKNPLEALIDNRELDEIKKIPAVNKYINVSLPKTTPLNKENCQIITDSNWEHVHLWIRMLFSCLTDADFLDTEKFMSPEIKRGDFPSIKILNQRFGEYMKEKQKESLPSILNTYRNEVLNQCKEKALLKPGFYSLTVPTGGGKTLSAMAFALRHAQKYCKDRIISAIPYTSIIEQTAKVYKYGTDEEEKIKEVIKNGKVLFGDDAVVEHHSNLDPDKEDVKNRLASENWDAPIIVTTNVQLFESLLASRSLSCRKLHNLVNSVIILDEAQMLPPEYLKPILSVLRGLVEYFGCTVLFCTATQPALVGKIGHGLTEFSGIGNVTEIIETQNNMMKIFKRVEIVLPDLDQRIEWSALAKELSGYEQVLCVVNTRRDCRDLHYLMPQDTVHLSANMCGEERSEVINGIKTKLKNKESIRVISTQLVEAGVDIDFPVVYRALAGIDSIVQAVGRCNREGHLNLDGKFGKVVVFQPPKSAPVGLLRKGEDAAKSILRGEKAVKLQPELFKRYFQQFYASLNDFDKPKFYTRLVQEADEFKFQFRTFAQHVQLIDDTIQRSIIVRYAGKHTDSNNLINLLDKNGPQLWLMRKLQRFIVNVPLYLFKKLYNEDHIAEMHGYWIQQSTGLYRPGYGLLSDTHQWDDDLYFQ